MGVLRLKKAIIPGNSGAANGACRVRSMDVMEGGKTIATLVESCRREGRGEFRPAGMVAELRSRPGRTVAAWLAEAAGRPVGLAAAVEAGAAPNTRHSIAWLLVADEARRRGVATALVETVRSWARNRGATELWVETRTDWADALAFWHAVGFRAVE